MINIFFSFIFFAMISLIIFCMMLPVLGVIKKSKMRNKSVQYNQYPFFHYPISVDKGEYGEYLVYKHLKSYEAIGGKFLFNTYVPKNNNENTEIDVMLILPQGIFVFESKNYSGWIFGNEKQKNWVQSLANSKSSIKEYFFNPIMQNKTHIKYLRKIVGKDVPIYSIIAFSERCELKNVQVYSNDVYVVKSNALMECVAKICDSFSGDIMVQNKIDEIYFKLLPLTNVSEEVKKLHIETINQKHYKNTQSDIICAPSSVNNDAEQKQENKEEINNDTDRKEDLICPRCSSKLVLRTAKRGENAGKQFYGCSNYPKCRYIMPVDDNAISYTNTTNYTPHNDCDRA